MTGAQGTSPAAAIDRYSYHPGRYRSRSARRAGAVADHDDPPCLAVAAARGKAGRVEHAVGDVVGHGVGKKFAYGARRAQRLDQVHSGRG